MRPEKTSERAGLANERKMYRVPNLVMPNNSKAANASYACIPMTALGTFLVVLVGFLSLFFFFFDSSTWLFNSLVNYTSDVVFLLILVI